MRPLSKVFYGSTSLFETQRVLCNSFGMTFGWFIPPQCLVDDVGQQHDRLFGHISPKFVYMSCCIYVTLKGLCTNIGTLYIVWLTSYLFRKSDYHVTETKTSQGHTIKLVCHNIFMCVSFFHISAKSRVT